MANIQPPYSPVLKAVRTAIEPGTAPIGAYGQKESRRAFPAPHALKRNLAGTAIVLACIALPFILAQLTTWTEEADRDRHLQALRTTITASPHALLVVQGRVRPQLLDQHYYFVNGRVASPSDYCEPDEKDWGEYYAELGRLYEQASRAVNSQPAQSFEEWAGEHVRFVAAVNGPAGAHNIAQALQMNSDRGDIHMVGTSVGGTAIISYLSEAMRDETPLDRRIRSVMTIDSPLGTRPPFAPADLVDGLMNGLQATSMRSDVAFGLGEWAETSNIAMFTVDTRQDIVGYDPLPGVANDANPLYPQSDTPPVSAYLKCDSVLCQLGNLGDFLDLGSTWHIYTGSHMATSAREFIDRHWR